MRDHLPLPTNRATWGQTAYSSTGGLAWKYAVDHTINSAPLNSDSSRGNVQAQLLHRDGHKWMLDLVPEIENELKTIWALSRFTVQTGATKVIRGSHRWPSVIALSPPPSEAAETVSMEPGSCLIYTSGVLHAGGNNQVRLSRWLGVVLRCLNDRCMERAVVDFASHGTNSRLQSLVLEKRGCRVPLLATARCVQSIAEAAARFAWLRTDEQTM